MLARRRDPWWGLEGRSARTDRRRRRILGFVVVVLAATLLAMILARIPAVDAHEIVTGSSRSVVFGALLADVAACMLLVVGQLRESFRS
ncbi:MAG TPA: hypothetical protein VFM38_03470 [Candidatus Limnocylindrales bacterium]|jgi:hypothetical protein|nr:hypothetical protein [Candidatus Limnocylindrales bacterium]